uniref:Uncharacterized protein n=1 Tax=Streptomyces arginensis TaxID=1295550 RepID=M1RY57_STREL|nr:hypothetical protein [Streptomyces arginensis]
MLATGHGRLAVHTAHSDRQCRTQILLLELQGTTALFLDEPTGNLDLESAEAHRYGTRAGWPAAGECGSVRARSAGPGASPGPRPRVRCAVWTAARGPLARSYAVTAVPVPPLGGAEWPGKASKPVVPIR